MKKRPQGIVFNNTSMLDVIFIILIFFISVSRLREGWLEIRLPEASEPKEGAGSPGGGALVVAIDAQNRILANERPVAGERELAEEARRHAAASGPDAPVVFVTDRACAGGTLVAALKAVTDEGLRQISFSYQPRKEAGR